jgi:CcmD family protein
MKESTSVFDFLNQQPLYVVLTVALVVWLGIFSYLLRLEGRLKKLERRHSSSA